MDIDTLKHNYKYHPPTPEKQEIFVEFRALAYSLAEYINTHVPEGREKALALTKLEEVVFWGNAGVARLPLTETATTTSDSHGKTTIFQKGIELFEPADGLSICPQGHTDVVVSGMYCRMCKSGYQPR